MRVPAYLMEIDLALLRDAFGKKPTFNPLPKFAVEKRDLALVMDEGCTCGAVEDCIRESCRLVTDVELFDIYRGGQIPEGKKSMAFTLTFTPGDEPLTGEAVDQMVASILKKLKKRMDIDLRA